VTAADIVRAWAGGPDRAVIFDFNGTLSDDEPILARIFAEIFAERLGWVMSAEEYRTTLLGRSDREIVEVAVRDHGGGDPALVEDLLELRRDRYRASVAEHSPITSGVVALVARLASAGVPMAVVTGAQRDDVEAVLAASPVGVHFKHLVTEEDVRRGKPDPEGFLLGAQELGVPPNRVLVLEDSVPGIRGALAAGMRCIAVTGSSPHPAVVDCAPATVSQVDVRLLAGSGI
jgi:HAD superfamily hydrolase (TIGR01509 family)